jgi:hypothetical protein
LRTASDATAAAADDVEAVAAAAQVVTAGDIVLVDEIVGAGVGEVTAVEDVAVEDVALVAGAEDVATGDESKGVVGVADVEDTEVVDAGGGVAHVRAVAAPGP